MRGWITDVCFDCSIRFAAHSLVRTAAGELLDVTYAAPGYQQYFIEHPAAAGEFFAPVRGEPPLPFVIVPREFAVDFDHGQFLGVVRVQTWPRNHGLTPATTS
ncbi:hypothetical protein [Burkholderia stagnalis]|uniref:hypothetical protein n=1 Tax=Burkholderia stagnalis TaxID=1503054 RepID=UPI000F5BFB2A|nr:hypothetical protein [Burkholderia stagnalis]RQP98876.1 hypothetical protein DF164_31220 [Burkholderia stagnalis]RQY64928.1 hypothetical protein DF110_30745 [Burkholderia stagnalis]